MSPSASTLILNYSKYFSYWEICTIYRPKLVIKINWNLFQNCDFNKHKVYGTNLKVIHICQTTIWISVKNLKIKN